MPETSKMTCRSVVEEARKPSLDVIKRARDQRWNWLGHILRMEEHRLVCRVLLLCVKPTTESIYGDVPDLDVAAVIRPARERIEWKPVDHLSAAALTFGEPADYNTIKCPKPACANPDVLFLDKTGFQNLYRHLARS